jgi:hypothetical protein
MASQPPRAALERGWCLHPARSQQYRFRLPLPYDRRATVEENWISSTHPGAGQSSNLYARQRRTIRGSGRYFLAEDRVVVWSGHPLISPLSAFDHHSVDVETSRALVRAPVMTRLVRHHLNNPHHATALGAWSVLHRTSDRGMFHNRSMSASEEWSRW